MELNREQIIKAFEHCGDDTLPCRGCPYADNTSECHNLSKNVLSLIKKLTEEVASWKEITETYQKQFEDCAEDRAKLTEENETLTLKVAAYQVKDKLLSNQLDDKCDMCIARERADTVRKMQDRFKSRFEDDVKYDGFRIAIWIDQIAEEMIKENGTMD